eukprot:evm.model.scf_3302.1 EVM.evm.TU.scf_3302.1   scf_3302:1145-3082(+)
MGDELEEVKAGAGKAKEEALQHYRQRVEAKGVTRIFQAEINIAIMSASVYGLWGRLLRAIESDAEVVGLGKAVPKHERGVKRAYLKTVAAFPEAYYEEFLGAVVSGSTPELAGLVGELKHMAENKGGPAAPWSSTSVADWFNSFRLHAEWTAKVATYNHLWRALEDNLPAAPTYGDCAAAVTDWKNKFASITGWEAGPLKEERAHKGEWCREFVKALPPSTRDPLSVRLRKPQEEAGAITYEAFTQHLRRGADWYPPFLLPKNALVSGTKGVPVHGMADTTFQCVLAAHEQACASQEAAGTGRTAYLAARLAEGSVILDRVADVVADPRQQLTAAKLKKSLGGEAAWDTLENGAELGSSHICEALLALASCRGRNWRWDIFNAPRESVNDAPPSTDVEVYVPGAPHPAGILSDQPSSKEEAEEGRAAKPARGGKRLRFRHPTEDGDLAVDCKNLPGTRPSPQATLDEFLWS